MEFNLAIPGLSVQNSTTLPLKQVVICRFFNLTLVHAPIDFLDLNNLDLTRIKCFICDTEKNTKMEENLTRVYFFTAG